MSQKTPERFCAQNLGCTLDIHVALCTFRPCAEATKHDCTNGFLAVSPLTDHASNLNPANLTPMFDMRYRQRRESAGSDLRTFPKYHKQL